MSPRNLLRDEQEKRHRHRYFDDRLTWHVLIINGAFMVGCAFTGWYLGIVIMGAIAGLVAQVDWKIARFKEANCAHNRP